MQITRSVPLVVAGAIAGMAFVLSCGGDGATTSDAAGPDAGPSAVTGTAADTLYESPTKTSSNPNDLTTYVLQAYVADDSPEGFRIINGGGTKGGMFSIPDVPAGSYYLLVVAPDDPVPHFYQTSSHAIDLGLTVPGRRDTPPATMPTPVTLHLTGHTAAAETDRLFVDSFSAGASALREFGLDPTGPTTTIDRVFDWKDVQAPLLDKTRPDDFMVVHTSATESDNPRITTRTIVDVFSTREVSLVDGQPASITGAFTAPTATENLSFDLDIAAYEQGLDVTNHQAIETTTRLRAGLTGTSLQGAPLLDVDSTTSLEVRALRAGGPYADPFPPEWERFLFNGPSILASYTSRKTTRATELFMNTFERRAVTGALVTLAPQFAAPHAIKLNGVDASRAGAIPFDGIRAVTVDWAPVVGVRHYIVTASLLSDSGTNAAITTIATFDTSESSVQMPAALFEVGDAYIISVSAVGDASTDYDSGSLRRIGFPYSRREAVTARMLFASSCGNGIVDAPVEECDAGGAESATCNADCTTSRCGDGITNIAAGEACDDTSDSLVCDRDCTVRACGDGFINSALGDVEACDDANTNDFDGCSMRCAIEAGYTCTGVPSVCKLTTSVRGPARRARR